MRGTHPRSSTRSCTESLCRCRRPCASEPASARSPVTRLLVRDLAQLVSPAGGDAPLRGEALGEVELVENAYVLCEEGRVAAVGRMSDLGPLGDEVEEHDGRGLCALPGLVDCHTHACFAGDRVD